MSNVIVRTALGGVEERLKEALELVEEAIFLLGEEHE